MKYSRQPTNNLTLALKTKSLALDLQPHFAMKLKLGLRQKTSSLQRSLAAMNLAERHLLERSLPGKSLPKRNVKAAMNWLRLKISLALHLNWTS